MTSPFGRHIASRFAAARHKFYVRAFSGVAPYLLVNEFPKSGGTWLAQMMSEALDIPFRRNAPIRLERSVTHGHFLSPLGLRNVVLIWRDPRDLLVSFYHHSYFVNEHSNALLVQMTKRKYPLDDYHDVRGNLPAFIRRIAADPVSPKFSWPQFAEIWVRRQGAVHTTYEALRGDTVGELDRVISGRTGQRLAPERLSAVARKYDFTRAKQQATHELPATAEISFIREGSVGGWKTHFSPDAIAALEQTGYAGPMKQLGYEL